MTSTPKNVQEVLSNIQSVSNSFALQRAERQTRRALDKSDFDSLGAAGYTLMAVPVTHGGLYIDSRRSTRYICEMLRAIAAADSSVALVSSMHPGVIGNWLEIETAPTPFTKAWEKQRAWIFDTAKNGHWWGTINSEPGSGGDLRKSQSTAVKDQYDQGYYITGNKHFGSGSGITSFMITRAMPEGETEPDLFFIDMRNVPWDGTEGVKLIAPWNGHGMTATQSHSMRVENMPATRAAFHGDALRNRMRNTNGRAVGLTFTAVILGIVETAIKTARIQLEPKKDSMRAYERTEWAKVETEGWLIAKAYESVLSELEGGKNPSRSALLCKEAAATLAESIMLRITKIVGGSAYSLNYPYGHWLDDVRALGFLRPPWGLAFDNIFADSWT